MITFQATPDRPLIRAAGKSIRYLHLRVTAPPKVAGQARAPVHVAFVIDRSGSMAGTSIELAKRATKEALGYLSPADRFAIVAFDDLVETVVAPTQASYAAVAAARERLEGIDSRGSTALCEGWLVGCGQIDPGPSGAGAAIARSFLLTDGHANVGETSPVALAAHAAQLRKRGVGTTTFGLGAGFSEELLQSMAAAGGGHFYFIEHAAQIRDFFASELGEALEVVARDVTVRVTHPAVHIEPLVAYSVVADRGGANVLLGDLCADQTVELIVKLTFPDGTVGDALDVSVEVGGRDVTPNKQHVRFTFAGHGDNDHQPRAVPIDRAVASVYAADARRKAVSYNRDGAYEVAAKTISDTAKRIRSYAAGDRELLTTAERLDAEAAGYATPMSEIARKRAHHGSTSAMKGRDESGRARKS